MATLVLAVLVFAYFLPWIVSTLRGNPNSLAIFVLDLLLGWTVLGWIIALVWALAAFARPDQLAGPSPRRRLLLALAVPLLFIGVAVAITHFGTTTRVELPIGGRFSLNDPIGTCRETSIAGIGSRLEGMPDSGSAVWFANGEAQVSYDVEPEITRSRIGDRVRMCLVYIPARCPQGDTRGRQYVTENLRTRESWTLSDSQHSCGGA